jgi:hypothetical protein
VTGRLGNDDANPSTAASAYFLLNLPTQLLSAYSVYPGQLGPPQKREACELLDRLDRIPGKLDPLLPTEQLQQNKHTFMWA